MAFLSFEVFWTQDRLFCGWMKGTGEFKNSGSDCGQLVQLVVVGCTRVGKGQSKGKVRKKMYPGAVMQK